MIKTVWYCLNPDCGFKVVWFNWKVISLPRRTWLQSESLPISGAPFQAATKRPDGMIRMIRWENIEIAMCPACDEPLMPVEKETT